MSTKNEKRIRRHKKIRIIVNGTKERPRLFVFRSNKHIYAQLINDELSGSSAKILMSASDKDLKAKKGKKSDLAKEVGILIAKKAIDSKISK
jgi:large subunit ribosomal protein L18